jgi:hypothetical protein
VFGLEEVPLDLTDAPVDPVRTRPPPNGYVPQLLAKFLRREEAEHERTDALHRSGRGFDLRRHPGRRERVVEIGVEVADRVFGRPAVAGGPSVRRVRHRRERLAVDVPPHPQWPAVAGDGEVQFAVRSGRVPAQELDAAPGRVEPLRVRSDGVVKGGERPRPAALEPDRLVGVEHGAVAVERGQVAAVVAVQAVPQPERDHVAEQRVPVPREQFRTAFLGGRVHGFTFWEWFLSTSGVNPPRSPGCRSRRAASRSGPRRAPLRTCWSA